MPTAGYIHRPYSFPEGLTVLERCLNESKGGPEKKKKDLKDLSLPDLLQQEFSAEVKVSGRGNVINFLN